VFWRCWLSSRKGFRLVEIVPKNFSSGSAVARDNSGKDRPVIQKLKVSDLSEYLLRSWFKITIIIIIINEEKIRVTL